MLSDEERLRALMLAGLGGDAEAHRQLLTSVTPLLRGFFRRRLRGVENDVEDLVQETLIAIHSKRATYDSARPFTAWAYALARYKLIDLLRRNRGDIHLDDLATAPPGEDFEPATTAKMDIETLLGMLPPKQAKAIRDTKILGLSVAEAAEDSGLSATDIKVSVHRGLKRLALRLKGEDR